MTMEHLRPLLDHPPAMHSFLLHCRSQTAVSEGSWQVTPSDGLVSRTIAQQLGPAVERATAPYQSAMSTKAGCECIAHVLQSLCEADPRSTVISVDWSERIRFDFSRIDDARSDAYGRRRRGSPVRAPVLWAAFPVPLGR